ncbi:MAG: hypothetical protein ACRDZR_13205 [Acidimicrobiales bacterium]
MPGLTLTQGMRNLMAHWGSINAAAATRLGVAGAWAALRTALGVREGTSVRGVGTIQDMNALYGLAAANRQAMENLMGAAPGAAITAEMIGLTPSSRTLAAMAAFPSTDFRIAWSGIDTVGEAQSGWVTVNVPGPLTGFTVTSLMTLLTTTASQLLTATSPPNTASTYTFGTIMALAV